MTDTEEHLADLVRAMAATDKAVMQLIVDELAEAMPGVEAAEDQAATALREALTALGKPESQLAELDTEIGRVTGMAADWQDRLSGLRVEDRVEARVRFAAWSAELDKLKEKRDQAERDLQPYHDARNKARGALELAQNAKRGLAYAMVTPYQSPVAQGTRAYVAYRQPRLSYVLLAADRAHPEWECAVAQLDELNKIVQSPEQAWQAMTAEMASAATTPADPAPNAADVMAADMVKLTNESMPPSRIEDHRSTPAPPRNIAPPRDYMQMPGRGVR